MESLTNKDRIKYLLNHTLFEKHYLHELLDHILFKYLGEKDFTKDFKYLYFFFLEVTR